MDELCEALSPGMVRDVCYRVALGVSAFHPVHRSVTHPRTVLIHIPRVAQRRAVSAGIPARCRGVDFSFSADGDWTGSANKESVCGEEKRRTNSPPFEETCGLLADWHPGGCARVVLLVEGGRHLRAYNCAVEQLLTAATTATDSPQRT